LKKPSKAPAGSVAALALFAIMALTFFDVGGRKLLSNSITGSLELTELLMVAVIFAGLPLVSLKGEHIVFDSLDGMGGPVAQAGEDAGQPAVRRSHAGAGLADVAHRQ
jgi:TRAP-type C4-dicarboxylate transport system permease small subunit